QLDPSNAVGHLIVHQRLGFGSCGCSHASNSFPCSAFRGIKFLFADLYVSPEFHEQHRGEKYLPSVPPTRERRRQLADCARCRSNSSCRTDSTPLTVEGLAHPPPLASLPINQDRCGNIRV